MTDNTLSPNTPPRDPFAARDDALARMHQHLVAESNPQALLFVGRKACGKTALLHAFDSAFDPLNVWGLYIDLRAAPLHDEDAWLRLLFTRAHEAALEHGFSAERLPTLPDSLDDVRAWLMQTGYPELFHVIRAARRIVYLLDNVDALLDVITRGTLPADHLAFLSGLLNAQCSMILTAPLADEDRLSQLAPLVTTVAPFRLSHFNTAQTAHLLAAVTGQPADETRAQAVEKAAGGQPMLTRRIADALARGLDLNAALDHVYLEQTPFFRQQWDALNENERRVLSAAAAMTYANPLVQLNAATLEAWLTDSDLPLDLTAVNAALRSLDYHEIVASAPHGVALRGDLLRRWLLEYARRPASVVKRPAALRSVSASVPQRVPRLVWALVFVGTLLLILLIVLAVASITGGAGIEIVPTVELN